MTELIVPEERGIYRVNARNFLIGAYTPDRPPFERGGRMMHWFIGIRHKFDAVYLDTEMALPLEKVGSIDDDRIQLWERYPGTICRFCGSAVTFHEDLRMPVDAENFVTPWRHDEPTSCREAEATSRSTYSPLFNLLQDIEDDIEFEQDIP